MLQLKVDPKKNNIDMAIMLKGEVEPLHINSRYEIVDKKEQAHIKFHDIKTSREWIDIVAKKYIENRKIDIASDFVELMGILG